MTAKIMGRLTAAPSHNRYYRTEPYRNVDDRNLPNHTPPDRKPFGQTRRDGSNVPACQHRVSKPEHTGPKRTSPCPNEPLHTVLYGKDLQALNLESPKLRTPVTETDLRSSDEHPFVNTGRIDKRVFDLQFYHALPSIEHRASTGDTSLTDTNNGHFAEPFILPKFIGVAWAIVLQDGMGQAEYRRLGKRAFLVFLGSVDNGGINDMRRQNRAIGGNVQTGHKLDACHFFIVGVGLDPLGRNLLQRFRKLVQGIGSLPVVHNHRARRNQAVTKRFPCHSCLPPGGKVKLIEPQSVGVGDSRSGDGARYHQEGGGSRYRRIRAYAKRPHCRVDRMSGDGLVLLAACTPHTNRHRYAVFLGVSPSILTSECMHCISCHCPDHTHACSGNGTTERSDSVLIVKGCGVGGHFNVQFEVDGIATSDDLIPVVYVFLQVNDLKRCGLVYNLASHVQDSFLNLVSRCEMLSTSRSGAFVSADKRQQSAFILSRQRHAKRFACVDERRLLSANKNALRQSWRDITNSEYSTHGRVMQGAISCQ